jgi:4'-phosphopantetheinyl transferase
VSDSSRRRDTSLRTTHLPQRADFAPGNLPTERIDLWIVPLAAAPERTDALSQFLSADERARAARFKFDRDRGRYVVGRGTLREILAFYLGTRPGEIGFAYGEHGKPMLADRAASRDIEFNASGSQDLAVCAVTVGRKVGVDIEFSARPMDEALITACLSAAERRAYATLSSEEKPAAFYRLWTLKEAYLKATGDGLSREMSALELTCLPEKPARLLADPWATAELGSWQFIEFAPAPRHIGALAVADGDLPVHYRHVSPADRS